MKTTIKISCTVVLFLFLGQAFAQYEISKHSINNGGKKLSGDRFELTSSIGQHDASENMSNGAYSLNSGFWQKNTDLIYKDEFE